jgi:hypothetical protein
MGRQCDIPLLLCSDRRIDGDFAKISLKIKAPFDTHNSAPLNFGILDELDVQGNGTVIAACSTDACIDGLLATSSCHQNRVLTLLSDHLSWAFWNR